MRHRLLALLLPCAAALAACGRGERAPATAQAPRDTANLVVRDSGPPAPRDTVRPAPRKPRPPAPRNQASPPPSDTVTQQLRDQWHQAPRDTVDQETYTGWKYFNLNCARCHGEDVQGTTIAPHLIMSLKPDGPINSPELFIQTVCAGRPEKGMPSWCALGLEMDKIQAIYKYVKARSDARMAPGRPALKATG